MFALDIGGVEMKKSDYLLLIANIFIATGCIIHKAELMAGLLAAVWTCAGLVACVKEGREEA